MSTSGQPADNQNAFRKTEKFYQLHVPQGRKGNNIRRRAQALQLPDLSGVVDLRSADCVVQCTATGALHTHVVPNQQRQLDISSLPQGQCQRSAQVDAWQPPAQTKAYTFPSHPGLLVIPAALPAAQQLSLFRDAFTSYCEPPARTNHDRAYGPLTGTWRAAKQGCVLVKPKRDAGGSNGDVLVKNAATHDKVDIQGKVDAGIAGHLGPGAQDDGTASVASAHSDHSGDAYGDGGRLNANDTALSIPEFDQCWGPALTGKGGPVTPITAAAMLRRMRWAVLGPHYDWSARQYVLDIPHRPLPDSLAQLAQHWAGVADGLQCSHTAAGPFAQAPAVQSRDGTSAEGTRAPYTPDGALVNYYYEGDTLMGHCDDVERDLQQPIVAVSLGCDGVFLMGGTDKNTPPTALLLRSGDVVVLAGAARRCYHGVPRVLVGKPLSDDLVQYVAACTADTQSVLQPFLAHMEGCRINISVRAVT